MTIDLHRTLIGQKTAGLVGCGWCPAVAFCLAAAILVLAGSPCFAQRTQVAASVEAAVQDDIDQRLEDLGYELPELSKSVGIYKRAVVVGNLVFLSGHISIDQEGKIMTGKVGDDIDVEQAQAAARRSALAMLASLKEELGSLNKVKQLVKTTGMVNCTPDFTEQSSVINGCSEVFRELFGKDRGVGTRAAVGMSSLPKGSIVEIEAIFEIK